MDVAVRSYKQMCNGLYDITIPEKKFRPIEIFDGKIPACS